MSVRKQFATFWVDGLYFGVEVNQVQEVIRHQAMTRVPLAPPVVSGLINLRGHIVTALDLRKRLGLRERAQGQLPTNVVIRTADEPVSVLVDEIGDVVEAEEGTFELPPDTLDNKAQGMICGVHKLKDRLMHVLEAESVLRLG